jgi:uncharacterized protein YjbI with pentapeptide repeats
LEDYASLSDGLLALYEATFDDRWFLEARTLADAMLSLFKDNAGPGLYDTDGEEVLITRPRSWEDGAIPSGNSMAADLLLRLAALTGEIAYQNIAVDILRAMAATAGQHPTAFGHLLSVLNFYLSSPEEIAIVGDPAADDTRELLKVVYSHYRPSKVVALGLVDGRLSLCSWRETSWKGGPPHMCAGTSRVKDPSIRHRNWRHKWAYSGRGRVTPSLITKCSQEDRMDGQELVERYGAGERDFRSADLSGAKLSEVKLSGTNLSRANLTEADLFGANLFGANLSRANLSKTNLLMANLYRANLSRADLRGANLSRANLFEATLSGAILTGANLGWAQINASLVVATMSDANLEGSNLRGAKLEGAELTGAKLEGADLRGADLRGADLRGADLRGAILSGANLIEVDLGAAGLRGAYLEGTDLSRSDLSEADLSWTNLNSTNLDGALLDGANLSSAQYDSATTWPDGFDIPSDVKFVSQGTTPHETDAAPTRPSTNPEDLGK